MHRRSRRRTTSGSERAEPAAAAEGGGGPRDLGLRMDLLNTEPGPTIGLGEKLRTTTKRASSSSHRRIPVLADAGDVLPSPWWMMPGSVARQVGVADEQLEPLLSKLGRGDKSFISDTNVYRERMGDQDGTRLYLYYVVPMQNGHLTEETPLIDAAPQLAWTRELLQPENRALYCALAEDDARAALAAGQDVLAGWMQHAAALGLDASGGVGGFARSAAAAVSSSDMQRNVLLPAHRLFYGHRLGEVPAPEPAPAPERPPELDATTATEASAEPLGAPDVADPAPAACARQLEGMHAALMAYHDLYVRRDYCANSPEFLLGALDMAERKRGISASALVFLAGAAGWLEGEPLEAALAAAAAPGGVAARWEELEGVGMSAAQVVLAMETLLITSPQLQRGDTALARPPLLRALMLADDGEGRSDARHAIDQALGLASSKQTIWKQRGKTDNAHVAQCLADVRRFCHDNVCDFFSLDFDNIDSKASNSGWMKRENSCHFTSGDLTRHPRLREWWLEDPRISDAAGALGTWDLLTIANYTATDLQMRQWLEDWRRKEPELVTAADLFEAAMLDCSIELLAKERGDASTKLNADLDFNQCEYYMCLPLLVPHGEPCETTEWQSLPLSKLKMSNKADVVTYAKEKIEELELPQPGGARFVMFHTDGGITHPLEAALQREEAEIKRGSPDEAMLARFAICNPDAEHLLWHLESTYMNRYRRYNLEGALMETTRGGETEESRKKHGQADKEKLFSSGVNKHKRLKQRHIQATFCASYRAAVEQWLRLGGGDRRTTNDMLAAADDATSLGMSEEYLGSDGKAKDNAVLRTELMCALLLFCL